MIKVIFFFLTSTLAPAQCDPLFSYNKQYKPTYDMMESIGAIQPILQITRYDLLKKTLSCIKKKNITYGKSWLNTEILYKEGIKQFIEESDAISNIKWDIINALKRNNSQVPLSLSYATLLSYKNTKIVGYNDFYHIKFFFHRFLSESFEQFDIIINRDNEERKNGKEVFYTSFPKEAYKMGYIDRKLRELISQKVHSNITLRVPSSKYINIKKLKSREHLMKNGTSPDWDCIPELQYRLISGNTTLFTNLNKPGESTFHYWIFNVSQKEPFFNTEILFKNYNMEHIYKRFEERIKNISIAGNGAILLQIIVHKKIANKSIYPSNPGGRKRTDIEGDTTDILNTIKQHPSFKEPNSKSLWSWIFSSNPKYVISNLQWRIIVTKSLIDDAQIIPYMVHSNAHLEQFHNEINDIFEEIEQVIEEERGFELFKQKVECIIDTPY